MPSASRALPGRKKFLRCRARCASSGGVASEWAVNRPQSTPKHGASGRSNCASPQRRLWPVSRYESESITPGRPVARSHRDRRSAGTRSGVVSAYILNKNPSASSNSVKTAAPCRGTFHEKYSATYVLKSSISSIVSIEPRKDSSGLYSRVCIPGSFYSLQPTAGACRIILPCRAPRLFTIASEAEPMCPAARQYG